MLRKISLPALFFLLLLVTCCKAPKDDTAQFVARVDSLFLAVPDFSGVVLIADKGNPIYHQAFGFKNIREQQPMDTAAVFELASVSKQFTAMVIMMLKSEGRLGYDEPLEKYIPGLPYPGITIRHLLTHTSGLPDYQSVMDQHWDKSKVAGNDDNIAYLIQYHPPALFAPGERYEYSNTGYMLLASIAEKASGHDFINFCRTRIFVPLKMINTDIRTLEAKASMPSMAWGHLFVPEKQRYVQADSFPRFNYSIWLGNRKGPGRISSTTTDLLEWDRALYNSEFLPNEELAEAYQPMKLNNDSLSWYGFGWTLQQHPTLGRVVRHSGSNPGYNTHIIRYLDKNQTIILLCNNAHEKFGHLLAETERIVASKYQQP